MTSAQNQLEQALKRDRDREERDRKRQRDDDLRHLRELEQTRRATLETFGSQAGSADALAVQKPGEAADFEYDVCLSFAGEERSYVEMVAHTLKDRGARVFYDRDETQELWGKDLVEHFDRVYRSASRYCVMFISEAYAAKSWTRHERRSALARALVERDEYVLPARFDDTELPGLPPTVGYVDLREVAPASLVEFVLGKLGLAGQDGVSPGALPADGDAPQDGEVPS